MASLLGAVVTLAGRPRNDKTIPSDRSCAGACTEHTQHMHGKDGPHACEEDMKERVSQAVSSCPMICSCVWWFASAICGTSTEEDQYVALLKSAAYHPSILYIATASTILHFLQGMAAVNKAYETGASVQSRARTLT